MDKLRPITIDNFLTLETCQYLINTYKDKVSPSATVDGIHSSRTSSTFYLSDSDDNVKNIKIKVSEYLGIPIENIENLQFLKYKKGEQYKYHNDYFGGDNIINQRVHTILVYLNTLGEGNGGETSFFHHKLKINPKEGMAVWFRNMSEDGRLVTESLHSGEPVLGDCIKYAINIWTRQHRVY